MKENFGSIGGGNKSNKMEDYSVFMEKYKKEMDKIAKTQEQIARIKKTIEDEKIKEGTALGIEMKKNILWLKHEAQEALKKSNEYLHDHNLSTMILENSDPDKMGKA